MPNIGVIVLKNSPRVARMFDDAWRDYYTNTKMAIRKHPGKDQNKVVFAMQHLGGHLGAGFGSNTFKFNSNNENNADSSKKLKWRFIPVTQAVLLDKMFKFVDQAIELGGEVTSRILAGMYVFALCVSCFECYALRANCKLQTAAP